MNSPRLDFAGCAGEVEGLGPRKRVVLWVRGCSLACPGCMTPELWESGPRERFHPVEEVVTILRPLIQKADGLTISGGEPMQQPLALKILVQLLRAEFPDLEVLVYSGYALETLREGETGEFLAEIDILIDQPYQHAAPNTLRWRGSDNQRVHLLSSRAQKYAHELDQMPTERPLQVQFLEAGQFRLIGIPRRHDLPRFRKLLGERGLPVAKVKKS